MLKLKKCAERGAPWRIVDIRRCAVPSSRKHDARPRTECSLVVRRASRMFASERALRRSMQNETHSQAARAATWAPHDPVIGRLSRNDLGLCAALIDADGQRS